MLFSLLSTHEKARLGLLQTAHGAIKTPAFMPVGTRASVKAMLPESVRSIGAEIILANTYHLMLRPGEDVVHALGGLRRFMNWSGPILTDSGGFQVMSLSALRSISSDGVTFNSHIDGKKYLLTPEYSTQIQDKLDSTISMVFDECPAYPIDELGAQKSMELTTAWALRSRRAFRHREGYGQFGIMQGSVFPHLREQSAKHLTDLDFEGYAIGGLAVGEGQEAMFSVLDYAPDLLPVAKPRYLMGVGKPSDIIGAVKRGVDMFDCVIPTRSGRNGQAFTSAGVVNIKNAKHKLSADKLDCACQCYTCLNYSSGYLHHLIKTGEILGAVLMTWHNLHYFQDLMANIRSSIENKQDLDRLLV
ncbi:Queuine tRNA-ribosyltransferase [Rickettsiales endosymbiont of Paramecium tredecaurelia]|uniref:tRNA guanosine(34) transglycosylase Tgt n=1 Tax=Candidatus Sarmatiella mevalonica TaxID=2770581 RepID=UPI00192513D6|nr:tRNA guanosine(34) transglycosylase Tgt [Candidatus Sarmatiella mevalonica]MBL3285295.1 Queuine tRNA-ribosyltransferase [Candidatus Sarmatiella mevalonica]